MDGSQKKTIFANQIELIMTLFGTYFETIPLILMALFAITFVFMALYYGLNHLRVSRYNASKTKLSPNNNAQPSVSVVLTSKNGEKLLTDNLTYLLEQNYPKLEVVVVDYDSFDNTQYVLQVFKSNYPDKLKIVRLEKDVNNYKGKKFPLSIGIQSAKNDIILLTENDCVPKSFDWVEKMVAPFANPKTQIVLGYHGLESRKGMLNAFELYENLSHSAVMFGSALMHRPYCGVGRNMAYRRQFFFDNKGFIKQYNIPYGDDDLFVNKNGNSSNTGICLEEEAYVVSQPPKTVGAWMDQRRRLHSTIKRYKASDKTLLLLRTLAVTLFYLCGILLYVLNPLPILGFVLLGVLVVKIAWQIVCNFQLCRCLNIKRYISALSPFFEIYFLFANTILFLSTLRHKNGNGSNS